MSKLYFNQKAVGLIGLFTLGGLLFLSLYFWMERTLYIDMAFHTFVIGQSQDFAIQNFRFGAALTQVFPLIAFKLNLPLATVLKLYSASFYILYTIYFVLIVFVFKRQEMAIVFLSCLVLITSCSFFWAQSELPQGLSFLVFFIAALLAFTNNAHLNVVKAIMLLAMLFTAVFFHPLLVIALVFSLIYLWLNKSLELKFLVAVLVAALALVVVKNFAFSVSAYESGKMDGVNNLLTLFPNYFSIKSNVFFAKQLVQNYSMFLLVVVTVAGYFIGKRLYLKLLWLVVALTSYTLLVNVSFPELGSGTYLQNMHLPLVLLVSLPFVFEVLPQWPAKTWLPVLLIAVFIRLGVIYFNHSVFSNRLMWLKQTLTYTQNFAGNKFVVADEQLNGTPYFDTWGLPYETLLYSSLSSPDSARTITTESQMQGVDITASGHLYINPYYSRNADNLAQRYYRLKDENYSKIELKFK